MQRRLNFSKTYDVAVIGGGVHGAAIAWEAQRRGFSTVLFEKSDFASGVSANALKIVHGGLRYLQTFDFKRSRQSAQEQSRLLELAPHLVSPLSCWMPTYREIKKSRLAMALGLWGYQRFIRPRSSHHLPVSKTTSLREFQRVADIPVSEAMTGAANWFDAQVHNPERLVLSYLFTARQLGAGVFNYLGVEDIHRFRGANSVPIVTPDVVAPGIRGARFKCLRSPQFLLEEVGQLDALSRQTRDPVSCISRRPLRSNSGDQSPLRLDQSRGPVLSPVR